MSNELNRRTLFKAAGVAGAAAVIPGPALAEKKSGETAMEMPPQQSADTNYADALIFLNDREAAFLRAAVDRIIPPDDKWPGAADAGVVTYIDRQLASTWGGGDKMYLVGPWVPDAPTEQGYQLRFTPAELYRIALAETDAMVQQTHDGRSFAELGPDEMDTVLRALESGDLQLPSVPSPVFFETLLANTIEGWFADPVHGGNRGMAGWRMVGFPGAYAQYIDVVEQHNMVFTRPPVSIADSQARHQHLTQKME